jgi:hypothetical protein
MFIPSNVPLTSWDEVVPDDLIVPEANTEWMRWFGEIPGEMGGLGQISRQSGAGAGTPLG